MIMKKVQNPTDLNKERTPTLAVAGATNKQEAVVNKSKNALFFLNLTLSLVTLSPTMIKTHQ